MNSIKRKHIQKKNTFVTYNKVISKIDNSKSSTAHSVIELSDKQWSRFQSRSILVGDMSSIPGKDNKIEYNNIQLGKDIILRRKKCISSGKHIQWKGTSLENASNGFMAVVGYKHEFIDSNPDLIVVDGSNQELLEDNMNDVTAYKPSGIVVLCLMKLEREQIHSQYLWGPNDAINVKKCKTNIITGHSTHFGSTGKYYSFGNRANYGMIDKSSITQFVHKKYKKLSSNITAEQQSQVMEELLANDLNNGVMSLVSMLPNLKQYIAPSLNVAFQV